MLHRCAVCYIQLLSILDFLYETVFEYQPRKSENWNFGVFFTFNPEQGIYKRTNLTEFIAISVFEGLLIVSITELEKRFVKSAYSAELLS